MTKTHKLAIIALKKQIQKIAFDANLYDRGLATYPHAQKSSEERKRLLAAIRELEGNAPLKPKPKKDTQLELFQQDS